MSSDSSDSRGTARRKRGQEATGSKPADAARFVDVREQKRLNDAREAGIPWKKWGEDGIGGLSDDRQRLCFALALWNGKDPILKERLFGLTNSEGNHGEDVKEYYFYVDSTPTHSYTKYLSKYPQGEFPYRDLLETNARRSREELESTSCSIPGLRRRPVLRLLPRVREGGSGRRSGPDHRHEPRARSRPAPPAPDALVPEHLDGEGGGAEAKPPRGQGSHKHLVLGHESLGRVLDPGPSSALAPGDLVVGIVRRPDPVACPSCAVGEWDICRNGRYTERGIKEIHGFMSERWRIEPECAMKIDPSLRLLGVLLEPTTVVTKAWEQIVGVAQRASGSRAPCS